ncbi:MAG: hypothetical protein HYY57_05270 [Candidatus Omnitrophica bacterium]|nr:hypothetical protein [Candidatus Omnitrophota bacterium]
MVPPPVANPKGSALRAEPPAAAATGEGMAKSFDSAFGPSTAAQDRILSVVEGFGLAQDPERAKRVEGRQDPLLP